MSEYIRFARLPFFLLALFLVLRLILGGAGVSYEQGTWYFSMVTLTAYAAFFFGAFARRLRGYTWIQAVMLGFTIALGAQILIFVATVASYLVGTDTYFNHPIALSQETPVGLGEAVVSRISSLVINCVGAAIVGLLGWVAGKLVPEAKV
jgi:hypothetical protein